VKADVAEILCEALGSGCGVGGGGGGSHSGGAVVVNGGARSQGRGCGGRGGTGSAAVSMTDNACHCIIHIFDPRCLNTLDR